MKLLTLFEAGERNEVAKKRVFSAGIIHVQFNQIFDRVAGSGRADFNDIYWKIDWIVKKKCKTLININWSWLFNPLVT